MAVMKLEAQEENFVRGLKSASGAVGELTGMINVQLARSFKGADFYSRNFEKGIGRLATSFKEAGQGMTIGLTLPLAFLAKSASDAYAELDSLKKGLGTLETTTEGLNGRLRELREIAKAPGIGFQEAIQGDLRLRSVGISAATSAKILKEFANAVALTGGGKEQLNEITVQLGQMAAKGKVLAQDLRPIIEAAPAVSQALKNMFGTVSSEAISEQLEKTGKSSTDMINMLLTELAKAPRVTGGWKNALENLGTSLFVAKAEMFEVADKLFDLQGILASVTSTVEGFVDGFKSLPEPLQKLIIGLTATVAILGPLAIGIGFVASALTSLVAVGGLTIASVTGIIGVVGLLTYAFMESTAKANDMRKATESIDQITAKASASIATETAKVMSLIDVIIDHKSSVQDVKSAKEALIALDPSFSKSLKGEEVDFDNLEVAVKKYVDRLKDASKVKLLQARFDENEAKKQKLIENPTDTSFFGSVIGEMPIFFGGAYKAQMLKDNLKLIKDYTEQNDKLADEIARINISTSQKIEKAGVPAPKLGGGGGKDTSKDLFQAEEKKRSMIREANAKWIKKIDEDTEREVLAIEQYNKNVETKRYDGLRGLLSYYASLEGIETLNQQEKDENKVYKELGLSTPDQIKKAWDKRISAMMEGQADEIAKRKKATDDAEKMSKEKIARIQEDINNFSVDMMAGIAESIIGGDPFSGILKQSLSALGNFAIQLGKQYFTIAKLKDMIFKNGITQNNALALIAGGVLVKGLASRITVPKLAQGGMATNPTLAMIGDNKSGKEMVLPFERTGEFADMIGKRMGGGGNFTSTARISGNDLLILTERAKRAK